MYGLSPLLSMLVLGTCKKIRILGWSEIADSSRYLKLALSLQLDVYVYPEVVKWLVCYWRLWIVLVYCRGFTYLNFID